MNARTLAIGILCAVTLAGCGSPRRGEPFVGPVALSDPSLQRGRVLYDRHCYKCHTEGEGGLGPILNDKPLPRFLMHMQVRVGLGTMPSFSRSELSDDELRDLLDYVVALRQAKSDRP
jgi:mono/diheme cytochrome c family protein